MRSSLRLLPAERQLLVSVALAAVALAVNPRWLAAQQPVPIRKDSAASAAPAAAAATPTLRAARLSGSITVDGTLGEPAWTTAEAASSFTQSYPKPGGKPTQRTEVRVLYDDAALYVGARMYDTSPDSIAAQLARRDATNIYSDWLHIVVDSYHDHRSAFRFSVNPRGVKKDVFHSDDTSEDLNWDAVWEVATKVDSLGWTAEYRIPFSQLRFGRVAADVERTWGLQIQRDIARNNERDSWSPWTQKDNAYVSRAGDLTGLKGITTPQRLELLPYASTRLARAPGSSADPFYRANDTRLSVGADLKYGLPGGLTLSATVNPDFGQVEVDPAVVNLSAFETFFPEKRPFFVEGASIFSFGRVNAGPSYNFQQFFYSRRIGRAPQRSVGGAQYVDAPDQSTILGAAKVSGKTGPWTVGFLDALTGQQTARYVSPTGTRGTTPVEPLTNYAVGRLRRDYRGGNTVIGSMFTLTNRSLGDTVFDRLLRSRGSFGGVDFEHSWARRVWTLSGYAAGTSVGGSRDVIAATQRSSSRYYQRPDADYLKYDPTRTSLGGYMTEVGLRKSGVFNFGADVKIASPGFEVNDIGFQGRTDYRSVAGYFGYQSLNPGRIFRNWNASIGNNNAWNFGGDRIWNSLFSNGYGSFTNFWSLGYFAQLDPDLLADRLTRGGPVAREPRTWNAGIFGGSDSRRTVTSDWQFSVARDVAGGSATSVYLGLGVRPSSSVRVTFGPALGQQFNTQQYVRSATDPLAIATYGSRYIFAGLRQTTLSADTRLDWTFTPTLSLQLYAQPFISAGRYSRFKELLAPRTRDFGVFGEDRGTLTRDTASGNYTADPDGAGPAPAVPIGNPDFNIRSLRGNAVVRWEYRPGSTLFFVWQQRRSDFVPFGDFSARRDVGAIFRQVPTNVFLVKATFWLAR